MVNFQQLKDIKTGSDAAARIQGIQTAIAAKAKERGQLFNLLGDLGGPLIGQLATAGREALSRKAQRDQDQKDLETNQALGLDLADALGLGSGGAVGGTTPITGSAEEGFSMGAEATDIDPQKAALRRVLQSGKFGANNLQQLTPFLDTTGVTPGGRKKLTEAEKAEFEFGIQKSKPGTGASRAARAADLELTTAESKAMGEGAKLDDESKEQLKNLENMLTFENQLASINSRSSFAGERVLKGGIDIPIPFGNFTGFDAIDFNPIAATGLSPVAADIETMVGEKGARVTAAAKAAGETKISDQDAKRFAPLVPDPRDTVTSQKSKLKNLYAKILDNLVVKKRNNPRMAAQLDPYIDLLKAKVRGENLLVEPGSQQSNLKSQPLQFDVSDIDAAIKRKEGR